jgi:hypothetical protein
VNSTKNTYNDAWYSKCLHFGGGEHVAQHALVGEYSLFLIELIAWGAALGVCPTCFESGGSET